MTQHPDSVDEDLSGEDPASDVADWMPGGQDMVQREALLDLALSRRELVGLVLEFGVHKGTTLERIAARVNGEVHGFDSFEGLPEDWTGERKKGYFSLEGVPPRLAAANVVLHKGLFSETLPPFLASHPGVVELAHIDCDLYSSTETVLNCLQPRLTAGSIIVFDEYFGYDGFELHEYRAFHEMAERCGLHYEYIGYTSEWGSAAVRIC
ncbi:MAG TPA: class I SAM-dependent methyltransferase [Thermoanaerobaculia bacterium]|nr:class I SAM-dependent methyltransferase [Thermoanaerobaculia bacterium]